MITEMREKLGGEIEALTHELTVTLPQAIAQAVEMGDLRENSETRRRWSASSSSRPDSGSSTTGSVS